MSWDEVDHPRGPDGKFGDSGGSASKSGSKFVSESGDVSITKKKKWEATGAIDDVSHHLERAKLHSARAQEFADKAAKATSDVDRKKWATKAAVSRKYAIQNAKMAEKFAKKSGDPAHQKMAAEARQLAETAKYHAGVAEHHASGAAMPGAQPIGPTSGKTHVYQDKNEKAIDAFKAKIEAPKSTPKELTKLTSGSQQELAQKAHDATVKALASGSKEDHLAANAAHTQAMDALKKSDGGEASTSHFWAANAHAKSAELAGTDKYDKSKAESGTLKHAQNALKEAGDKLPGQLSFIKYSQLMSAHAATLSKSEKSAAEHYTGSGYAKMNSSLRKGETPVGKNGEHIHQLDSAIAKNSLPTDTVLYRGMGGSANYEHLDEGDVFEDKGFVSTSAIKGSQFGGQVNLEIHAPAGHPALAVRAVSEHPSENEVILPRGSKFEVMSKEIKTSPMGNMSVHLKVRVVPIDGQLAKKAA